MTGEHTMRSEWTRRKDGRLIPSIEGALRKSPRSADSITTTSGLRPRRTARFCLTSTASQSDYALAASPAVASRVVVTILRANWENRPTDAALAWQCGPARCSSKPPMRFSAGTVSNAFCNNGLQEVRNIDSRLKVRFT